MVVLASTQRLGDRGAQAMTASLVSRVSVVIPACNAAGYIERTLDSVRSQTYTDYELIVVDDGSTDETPAIAAAYLERHGVKGRCIRQANRKVAAARNAGMRAASGDYIALLDADDSWYPEKLAVVMREFVAHPEADLVCHNEHILIDDRIVRTSNNARAAAITYEQLLFAGNPLSPSATVFRKAPALAIGGFDERLELNTVEDYDFWLRLSRVARFHFVNAVLGAYRFGVGVAAGNVAYHHANLETMLKEHLDRYFEAHPARLAAFRSRKRLSAVYRSAASHLMTLGGRPEEQRRYVLKMLRTCPFDSRNLARALLWLVHPVGHA